MINHSRTLLANVVAGSLQDELEDYIDPTFVPLRADQMPGWLVRLREILLGKNPDRDYLLYRVRDLLAAVYSSGNADFLEAYDPRVTHSDGTDNLQYHPQIEITQYAGPTNSPDIHIFGTYDDADPQARIHYRFKMTYEDFPDAFTVRRITPGPLPTDDNTWESTQRVPLRGTGVTLYKDASPEMPLGTGWNIDIWLKPKKSLGTLVQELEALGDVSLAPLLSTAAESTSEPLKSFRMLWLNGKDTIRRITGIALAVIWHMELLRRKRDGNR